MLGNLLVVVLVVAVLAWKFAPRLVRNLPMQSKKKQKKLRADLTINRPTPGPFARRPRSVDDLVIDDADADAIADRLRAADAAADEPPEADS